MSTKSIISCLGHSSLNGEMRYRSTTHNTGANAHLNPDYYTKDRSREARGYEQQIPSEGVGCLAGKTDSLRPGGTMTYHEDKQLDPMPGVKGTEPGPGMGSMGTRVLICCTFQCCIVTGTGIGNILRIFSCCLYHSLQLKCEWSTYPIPCLVQEYIVCTCDW